MMAAWTVDNSVTVSSVQLSSLVGLKVLSWLFGFFIGLNFSN